MCLSLLFIFLSCNFSYSSLGLVLTVRTTVNKILILLLREGGYAHKIMLRNVWALRKPSLLLLTLHMVLTSEFIIYIYIYTSVLVWRLGFGFVKQSHAHELWWQVKLQVLLKQRLTKMESLVFLWLSWQGMACYSLPFPLTRFLTLLILCQISFRLWNLGGWVCQCKWTCSCFCYYLKMFRSLFRC